MATAKKTPVPAVSAPAPKTKIDIPKTPGAAIDLLYTIRQERLAIEKQAEAKKAIEEAIRTHIMNNFAKLEIDGAKGKLATAALKPSTEAKIVDWEKFVRWVVRTKNWGCIQKRPGITSIRELWEAEKPVTVDGVEPVPVTTLTLNKVGAK